MIKNSNMMFMSIIDTVKSFFRKEEPNKVDSTNKQKDKATTVAKPQPNEREEAMDHFQEVLNEMPDKNYEEILKQGKKLLDVIQPGNTPNKKSTPHSR
ncbi:MAG: hypothetical protein AABY27_07110 [Pseudomonadota bacterium]